MSVSLHVLAAVLLAVVAIVVVVCEPVFRRRLARFRPFQALVLGSALVLIPINAVFAASGQATGAGHHLALIASASALTAEVLVAGLYVRHRQVTHQPRRILAVGAHPDDLELACGGTLARLVDSGHEVHALVMSSGAVGGDVDRRAGEAHRAGALIGVTSCTVGGLPDTRLDESVRVMTNLVEEQLQRHNPDIILTHSAHDQHQDHLAVNLATMRAARAHPAILCYESPSVTADFKPQVFVDIEDYLPAKAAAVAEHADQRSKSYMNEEQLSARATFRGAQGRTRAAESFEAVRISAFRGVL